MTIEELQAEIKYALNKQQQEKRNSFKQAAKAEGACVALNWVLSLIDVPNAANKKE